MHIKCSFLLLQGSPNMHRIHGIWSWPFQLDVGMFTAINPNHWPWTIIKCISVLCKLWWVLQFTKAIPIKSNTYRRSLISLPPSPSSVLVSSQVILSASFGCQGTSCNQWWCTANNFTHNCWSSPGFHTMSPPVSYIYQWYCRQIYNEMFHFADDVSLMNAFNNI